MGARDPGFFDHLASLLELERREESARIAAARAELSLKERAGRGLAIVDLVVADDGFGLGGRVLLTLKPDAGAALPPGRIDAGDLVSLRPRRAEIAEAPTAVVARRGRGELVLAFEKPPPPFVHGGRLVVELLANDVTYSRLTAGLAQVRALAEGGGPGSRRVAALLGQSAPRRSQIVPAEEGPADGPPLNPEQRAAVEQALRAEDFYLIHGPPGTGKSHVLVEIAARAARRGERVLCTAASNAAVDHLLELCVRRGLRAVRIGHPARIAERLHEFTLGAQLVRHPDRQLAAELFAEAAELRGYARKQRVSGRSADRFANARDARRDAQALINEARALERRAVAAVLGSAQVVCATLSSLPGHELDRERFDWALLDEATQATEPLSILGFLRCRRLVLAGDPCQLPPTVLSQEAQARGLARSLLERLMADPEQGPESTTMLCEQHRMHAAIAAFPSQEFYGGALRDHPLAANRTLAAAEAGGAPPLLFIDTAGKGWDEEQPPGTDSYQNPGEAELVLQRLRALLDAGLDPAEAAVIAPYSAQVALLRALAPARLGAEAAAAVEIDSVDAFQGREKDAVLVSLVRSSAAGTGGTTGPIGFLADLRRLNVAITRARKHLLLVGDSGTVGANACYARLIARAEASGGYRSVWEYDG
jgi:hypothetical protein